MSVTLLRNLSECDEPQLDFQRRARSRGHLTRNSWLPVSDMNSRQNTADRYSLWFAMFTKPIWHNMNKVTSRQSANVSTENVSSVSYDCQAPNQWDFAKRFKKLIAKIFEGAQELSVFVALGCYKELQPQCSKRFQLETKYGEFGDVFSLNAVYIVVFQQGRLIVAFEVCMSIVLWSHSSRLLKTALLQLSQRYSLCAAECRLHFFYRIFH